MYSYLILIGRIFQIKNRAKLVMYDVGGIFFLNRTLPDNIIKTWYVDNLFNYKYLKNCEKLFVLNDVLSFAYCVHSPSVTFEMSSTTF